MPVCIICSQYKPHSEFKVIISNDRTILHLSCKKCESVQAIHEYRPAPVNRQVIRSPARSVRCPFCGGVVKLSSVNWLSKRIYECEKCLSETNALIEKNRILKSIFNIEALLRKTKRMSTNLIGDLRSAAL